MAGETRRLAAYAASIDYASLPPEVPERAKALLIDFVGSIVRGADVESTPPLYATVAAVGLDAGGPCTVFGDLRSHGAAAAALLNGALGHSLDFDDTHAASSLHPTAPVMPAALAIAEMTRANGADLLAAIVGGYEVCCRLGLALDPTAHYARGFHPTATAGTFGAAAAAGRLLKLSPTQMEAAFGIAASQAAGCLQFLVNGAWNKRYQVGAAAMNGVIAATLAHKGYCGAAEAIEGDHGFLSAYSDGAKPSLCIAGLGESYETMRIGIKPYPSCRYTHAALDGLLAIRREAGLDAARFSHVTIGLHQNGIVLTGAPLPAKRRPATVVDGQFSMPFTAAVAIARGTFGWDDYALLGNAEIEGIADRIDVRRDERLEGGAHPFGASLAVETPDGMIERIIADPSGEPENFPDSSAIRSKFLALAGPRLGVHAGRLHDALSELDRIPAIGGDGWIGA